MNRSSEDWLRVPSSVKHSDLIKAIRKTKAKLPITVDFHHVYGHQDDHLCFDSLPRLAQLNVLMDRSAKRYLVSLIANSIPGTCPELIRGEGWSCWVADQKMTGDPSRHIRNEIFGTDLREHLDDRGILTADAFALVDWDALGDASDTFPALYRLWVSKHVSGHCGVGKMIPLPIIPFPLPSLSSSSSSSSSPFFLPSSSSSSSPSSCRRHRRHRRHLPCPSFPFHRTHT